MSNAIIIIKIKQLALLIVDFLLMYGALAVALLVRYGAADLSFQWSIHARPFALVFVLWLVVLYVCGMYDLARARNSVAFFKHFFEAMIIAALLAAGFFYLLPAFRIAPKTNLFLTIVLYTAAFVLWRVNFNAFLARAILKTRVLFVGRTNEVDELISLFHRMPQLGYEVPALIDPSGHSPEGRLDGTTMYHALTAIRPAVSEHQISLVVIAGGLNDREDILRELYELLFWKISMTNLETFYELMTGCVPASAINERWFLRNLRESRRFFYDVPHVLFDYLLALFAGVFFVITLPLIALAIKIDSRGPVFYKQERIGYLGKTIMIFKFRSMLSRNEHGGAEDGGAQFAEENDGRVTGVGKFLRTVRLDELPQIWNVLKGEMSVIGPRPERPEFVSRVQELIPFFPVRHLVKPGITGWAQINFPYTRTLEELRTKLQYDLFYIKNRSLVLDATIILKTVAVILRRLG